MALQRYSLLGLVFLLASCADQDPALEGDRLTSRGDEVAEATVEDSAPKLSLRKAKSNKSWTHVGGSAQHWVSHPALGKTLSPIWSVQIGAKDTKRNRTSSVPVMRAGRIFTQDSLGTVTAVSTSGALLWQVNLTPQLDEANEAGGGGLAVDADAVYATTGAGHVVALDPENGDDLWDQNLESFGGSAPTVYKDLVYISARDGAAWAIEKDNGRIRWQLAGPSVTSSFVGGPGPAITDKWALFPYGSGEILSTFRQGGLRNWTASVTGGRDGVAVATVKDILADPVIVGSKVFVGTAAGPTVALDLLSGERLWTSKEGAFDGVSIGGGSVFLVSDENKLMRLSAETGEVIWSKALPRFLNDKVKRRKGVVAHYGPVIAGGRLIVASSDGLVRLFNPRSGAEVGSLAVPSGAAASPIVANSTLYVQSRSGLLHAFK